MTHIFSKKFFAISVHGQAAVVEAALHDIEKNYWRYITPEDEKRRGSRQNHPEEGDQVRALEWLAEGR